MAVLSLDEAFAQAARAHERGDGARAAGLCDRILEVAPLHAGALHLLGQIHRQSGQAERAERLLRRAILVQPDGGGAYAQLGMVRLRMRDHAGAVTAFRRALLRRSGTSWIPRALGLPLADSRDPAMAAVAVGALRAACCQKPDDQPALSRLGAALVMLRRDAEALTALRRSLRLRPGDAATAVQFAHTLLRNGQIGDAYDWYEHRYDVPGYPVPRRRFDAPEWDGRPLGAPSSGGRTLFLYAERDFGDTLQHLRFILDVAKGEGRIVVECQPELAALVAAMPAVDAVVPQGATPPPFDTHAAIGSLPRLIRPGAGELARHGPYLSAAPRHDLVPRDPGRLSVGLIWAGRPGANRACPLAALAPLLAVEGAAFHALQLGPAAAEIAGLPAALRPRDLGPAIGSFADTAGVMAALDLVISVDTAAVHLAGALGRPTWLLLSNPGAYRWQMAANASPWYSTMVLLRQRAPGDWEELGRRAADRLRTALALRAARRNAG